MLNRRLMRIKAMQSIYAYKQLKESLYLLGIEQLKEHFQEELLTEGLQEKTRLMKEEKLTLDFFQEFHDKSDIPATSKMDKKYYNLALNTILAYRKKSKDEFNNICKKMIKEVEGLFFKYLKILRYILDLADVARTSLENKSNRLFTFQREQKFLKIFSQNEALISLRKNAKLRREFEKFNIHADNDEIKEWYKWLLKEEGWDKFENVSGFEESKALLTYLIEDFILKNENIVSSFEVEDLHWTENQKILKNLLNKTIKELEKGNEESANILSSISENWEEDKIYFEILYKNTLEEEPIYEALIEQKSEKWRTERIAKVDKVLINMAITEMVNFPSIPVKVTINEYIDISKKYSTPKSWQFLNGMLDAISKQMIEEGKIKKSGRGLLDNK
ncbi:MAG: transcription antitermination factor NusB [Flammeovirgaceae bacterium]